jgi:hypothetical protein
MAGEREKWNFSHGQLFREFDAGLSCNFTSMIAASGLCVLGHFSADTQSGKEAPTEKPVAATVP